MAAVQRAVSLRLTEATFQGLKDLATARGLSMNRVVEEELQATILREKSKRLSEAFKKIAEQGKEYNSVEYAHSAQAEIALSGSSD